MNAWTKRFIWYFGIDASWYVNGLVYFYTHGVPFEIKGTTAARFVTFLMLGIIQFVPMFFMNDDKVKK